MAWLGLAVPTQSDADTGSAWFLARIRTSRAQVGLSDEPAYVGLQQAVRTCGYHRHSFARQHNVDPSTEGLADQQRQRKISDEDWKREEQERAGKCELWARKARDFPAWGPRGTG